jgi:hypothetical protein
VADRDGLRTLPREEFRRAVARVEAETKGGRTLSPDELFAAFGAMPELESPEGRAAAPPREPARIGCFDCERPVAAEDDVCPHCGASRLAPPCPRCGRPVSRTRSVRAWYEDENGRYPWHHDWDGRCAHCGFEIHVRAELESGHASLLATRGGPTHAEVEVRGGESVWTAFDAWDYRPTIVIRVRRPVPANRSPEGEGLRSEERITLTPEEWRFVSEQLSGPLRLLLDRRPWDRDTT